MRTSVAFLLIAFLATGLAAQADPKLLAKNLSDAQAALKAKKYDDALIACKAALVMDSLCQQAWEYKSDALIGLNRSQDALDAALAGVDCPKRADKGAKTRTQKLQKRVAELSPNLGAFLDTRDACAASLISLNARASKDKRRNDSEWIVKLAKLVSPCNEGVEAVAGPGLPRARSQGKSTPDGLTTLLTSTDDWTFENEAAKTRIKDGELYLVANDKSIICDAGYKPGKLAKSFSIKAQVKFKVNDPEHARFSFNLADSTEVMSINKLVTTWISVDNNQDCQLLIRDGPHGTKWRGIHMQKLPKEGFKAETWMPFEVSYDDAKRSYCVTLDGKTLLETTLPEDVELPRVMRIAVAAALELWVKDLRATIAQ